MNTLSPLAIAIGSIAIVAIIGLVVTFVRNRHSARLRDRYGEEYGRTVQTAGSARAGESLLNERERRVAAFHIRPLAPAQRHVFIDEWLSIQTRFVDDPSGAVIRADVLLSDVMLARGYPVADFEQRFEDLSVDYAEVIDHYRTAHSIAQSHGHDDTRTEELRRAMIHYRALFDDLVNEPDDFSPVIENRDGRTRDWRKESTRRA